jgi:class 3 adenylate cyclase
VSTLLDPGGTTSALASPGLLHELRTSLNVLIGYTEMLLEDLRGEAPQRAGLERIRSVGRQLLGTVNERLARTAGEAGRGQAEQLLRMLQVELAGPAAETVELAERLLAEAGSIAVDRSRQPDLERIASAARCFARLLDDLLSAARARNPSTPAEPVGAEAGPGPGRDGVAGASPGEFGRLLVVDDNEANLDLLYRRLGRQGHEVEIASSGRQALAALALRPFDLVLLDVVMPGMDGYQVLVQLKAEERFRHVPVIMMSALGELDSVVRCIELGAEDYLTKPFEPVLLKARVDACLGKKRMRDRELDHLRQLQEARARADALLRNVLPDAVADRLEEGHLASVDRFPEVTVLFLDISGFSGLAARLPPARVVEILNQVFSAFDVLADQHRVEKIKTIGDAYMAAAGLPEPRAGHVAAVAEMALEMRRSVTRVGARFGETLRCRIGIHTGPVIAGIIGTKRFSYDLWGDTVNVASRMESHGVPGQIQISRAVKDQLGSGFLFEARGPIDVKGLGSMEAYFLVGRRGLLVGSDGAEPGLSTAASGPEARRPHSG